MVVESGWDEYALQLQEQLEALRINYRREQGTVRELKGKIQELGLAAQAVYELLMERAPVSVEELRAKIEEVDRRDGVVDGRLRDPDDPRRCPRCDRVLIKSASYCLYCGPDSEE